MNIITRTSLKTYQLLLHGALTYKFFASSEILWSHYTRSLVVSSSSPNFFKNVMFTQFKENIPPVIYTCVMNNFISGRTNIFHFIYKPNHLEIRVLTLHVFYRVEELVSIYLVDHLTCLLEYLLLPNMAASVFLVESICKAYSSFFPVCKFQTGLS